MNSSSDTDGVSITPVLHGELTELRKLVRELAEFERLLDQAVATRELLEAALFADRPGLYLEDLYVRPQQRGLGYGDALLRHLARLAVARTCGRMEWAVLNWNQHAMGRYRKMGARPMSEWIVLRVDGANLKAMGGR